MFFGEKSIQWVVLTEVAKWDHVYHAPVNLVISAAVAQVDNKYHSPYMVCVRPFHGDVKLFPRPAVSTITPDQVLGFDRLDLRLLWFLARS